MTTVSLGRLFSVCRRHRGEATPLKVVIFHWKSAKSTTSFSALFWLFLRLKKMLPC